MGCKNEEVFVKDALARLDEVEPRQMLSPKSDLVAKRDRFHFAWNSHWKWMMRGKKGEGSLSSMIGLLPWK